MVQSLTFILKGKWTFKAFSTWSHHFDRRLLGRLCDWTKKSTASTCSYTYIGILEFVDTQNIWHIHGSSSLTRALVEMATQPLYVWMWSAFSLNTMQKKEQNLSNSNLAKLTWIWWKGEVGSSSWRLECCTKTTEVNKVKWLLKVALAWMA